MKTGNPKMRYASVPKRRRQHHAYDDNVNEPAKLIEDEAVGIEQAAPAEENEPLERVDDDSTPDLPAFEE